jgi:hypothetical protein
MITQSATRSSMDGVETLIIRLRRPPFCSVATKRPCTRGLILAPKATWRCKNVVVGPLRQILWRKPMATFRVVSEVTSGFLNIFRELKSRLFLASNTQQQIIAQSWRCGEFSSAAAAHRRGVLQRSVGTRVRRCQPGQCGRSRAPPNTNSDNSRRRWRTIPWR